MARGRNNKLRKEERKASKLGMPLTPLDKLPTPTSSARSRLTATIEEKKQQQQQASSTGNASAATASSASAPVAPSKPSTSTASAAASSSTLPYGSRNRKPNRNYTAAGGRLNSYLAGFAGANSWCKDDDQDDHDYYGCDDDGYYDEDDDYYYDEDHIDEDGALWADEDDDHPGPRSTSLHYGWGRRDDKAKSKAKSQITSKSAAGSAASGKKGSPPDPRDDEDLCDHTGLAPTRMRTVTTLLNDIFCASFRMALPSLYRGMVYNLQDEIMRDKLMGAIDKGLSPKAIRNSLSDSVTRQEIKTQLKLACQDELGDVVLRLSTEDAFDLLCDLAVRHGRNLRLWGPACACSFSHCLPCLERLVNTVKTTPPPKDYSLYSNPAMDSTSRLAIAAAAVKPSDTDPGKGLVKGKGKKKPKPGTKPIAAKDSALSTTSPRNPRSKLARRDLMSWVASLIEADWIDKRSDWAEASAWEDEIWQAWQSMNDVLWEVAEEIDPMSLARVAEYLTGLGQMNGLDLYYAVVTRELTYNPSTPRKKPAPPKAGDSAAQIVADTISWEGIYERMKKETREMRKKQRAEERGKGKADGFPKLPPSRTSITTSDGAVIVIDEDDDVDGSDFRRALARAVREQGNSAYARGAYYDAVDHYTRAIGYDVTEPIYPLNRAACLLKLRLFEDAERDCTAAIRLDPGNHKAYFRRGASRAGLGKVVQARQDFDKVLELQADVPEAHDELRRLAEKFIAEAPAKGAVGAAKGAGADGKAAADAARGANDDANAEAVRAQMVKDMLDEQDAYLKAELKRHAREDAKERQKKRRARLEAASASESGANKSRQHAHAVAPGVTGSAACASQMAAATASLNMAPRVPRPKISASKTLELSDSEDSRHLQEDADDSDVVAPSSATSDMAQGGRDDGKRSISVTSSGAAAGKSAAPLSGSAQTAAALGRAEAELNEIRQQLAEMRDTFGIHSQTATPGSSSESQQDAAAAAAAAELQRLEALKHGAGDSLDPLLTHPSETVACWTTFAFVFSLIVAQKTGINVPERLGFVRQYGVGRRGGSCVAEMAVSAESGPRADALTLAAVDEQDSLVTELQRAAEARKSRSSDTGTGAAGADTNAGNKTTSLNDTLELLRSVPLEDHLDRIVNFLRQPEVQPVLAI
ncbi:hypothetical protein V8E36_004787 [Tilletia maclaganii]